MTTAHQTARTTLAQRLYLSCTALILAMMLLAGAVWHLLSSEAEHAQDVVDHRVPQLLRIAEIELNVTRTSLQLRHAMLARNEQELKLTLADIESKRHALESTVRSFGAAMDTAAGREAFRPLPALMAEFWAVGGENLKLILAGQKDEAFAFLVERTIPARNRLLGPLAAEKQRQGESLAAEVTSVSQEARFARNLVLSVVLLVSLGLVGLTVYLVRVMRQLGAEPDELKRVANQVAAGNLQTRVVLRSDDAGSVMSALKLMADHLATTVRAVRENAETVAGASQQIATGNADLSGRTEQQASALQETAASMEELGATVRQNADNARQANELAHASSTVAARGGAMVHEVVKTMRDINHSSHRIADIIGVIDGIAFQTNILALNAAVEAARAGEQGRGFAVVASEVRGLAQRSAAAAREIKTLIGDSVTRVEEGSALVDRAGATMQEIVDSIQRVATIVGSISHASVEQSEGVSQVGTAVARMDQTTQQNAALVEQSAEAAERLRQQSQSLVQAVSVFKLA